VRESSSAHVSAGRRRRQRLRRTLTVLLGAAVVTGLVGFAVHRAGDEKPTAAVGSGPGGVGGAAAAPGGAEAAPSTQETPPPEEAPRSPAGDGLPPVVTDRIPAPTSSIALSASVPGTTNMQESAAAAVASAFAAARRAGEQPGIKSAWRSAEWQQVLFDRAVATYGSTAEATKWVLPPGDSAHVKGYAVDVSPRPAARWLEAHGAAYGLCRTYDNEWWHFEYLATTSCPPRKPTAGS